MAHFAQVDENSIVVQVIVISNENIKDETGVEQEPIGIAFCKRLTGEDTTWIQTSYNTRGGQHQEGGTPIRKNYAGIGMIYDAQRDAFIPPKKHDSWVLDESTGLYEPPIPRPDDDKRYHWDEDTVSWVEWS